MHYSASTFIILSGTLFAVEYISAENVFFSVLFWFNLLKISKNDSGTAPYNGALRDKFIEHISTKAPKHSTIYSFCTF